MQAIGFLHQYHKLENREFSTIRGKSHFSKHKIGEVVEIRNLMDRVVFHAEITALEQKKISEIPLDFLKNDGEFPGFTIRSHGDFIGLINSMRQYNKIQSAEELVTIITFKRVEQ